MEEGQSRRPFENSCVFHDRFRGTKRRRIFVRNSPAGVAAAAEGPAGEGREVGEEGGGHGRGQQGLAQRGHHQLEAHDDIVAAAAVVDDVDRVGDVTSLKVGRQLKIFLLRTPGCALATPRVAFGMRFASQHILHLPPRMRARLKTNLLSAWQR